MTPSGYSLRVGKCVAWLTGVAALAVACAVPTAGTEDERTGEGSAAVVATPVSNGNPAGDTLCYGETIWSETGLREGVCFPNSTISAEAAGLPCGCTNGVEYYAPADGNEPAGDDENISYAFACPFGVSIGSLNLPLPNDPYVSQSGLAWDQDVTIVMQTNALACYGDPAPGWGIVIDFISLRHHPNGCKGSACNGGNGGPIIVMPPPGFTI